MRLITKKGMLIWDMNQMIRLNWYMFSKKQNNKKNMILHMSQREKSPLCIQSPEETSRVWILGSRFSVPVPYYTQLKKTHTHTQTHTHTFQQ